MTSPPAAEPLPTSGRPNSPPPHVDIADQDALLRAPDADSGERIVERMRGRATNAACTMSTDEIMTMLRDE